MTANAARDNSQPGRRVAVVTGAARGIGRAICERLARDGALVVAVDLSDSGSTLSGLDGEGHLKLVCDVSDPEAVSKLGETVARHCGHCDVLVNSAGVLTTGGLAGLSHVQWRRTMAVNVDASLLTAQTFAPGMANAGGGRIVNIGSTITRSQAKDVIAYMTSKGAVHALTRALANELAGDGITVNAIAPSIIPTEGLYARAEAPGGLTHDQEVDLVSSAQTIKRRQRPSDVADAVAFLAGPSAGFITGQIIYVDGGLTRTGG